MDSQPEFVLVLAHGGNSHVFGSGLSNAEVCWLVREISQTLSPRPMPPTLLPPRGRIVLMVSELLRVVTEQSRGHPQKDRVDSSKGIACEVTSPHRGQSTVSFLSSP